MNIFSIQYQKPSLNFVITFVTIVLCLLPKFFGIQDSFNVPGANDHYNKKSMKTTALLLLLSASPTLLDNIVDAFTVHRDLKKNYEVKISLLISSILYILVSLDILAKLGYSPIHISPPSFCLSFEFLVWLLRLNTTAALMFAMSVRSPELYSPWKTSIVTISVSSYGLLRYVLPYQGDMDTFFYRSLFFLRILMISFVHYIYSGWVYSICMLRKWTVNDWGIFFNLLVFTMLTLDFIKNGIYKIFYYSVYSAVINLDHLNVERTMIDLIIAKVMFSVIPNRLAKIEMIKHKDNTIETRKAFIRYISHELRTPLNTVFSGIKLAIKQHMMSSRIIETQIKDRSIISTALSQLSLSETPDQSNISETQIQSNISETQIQSNIFETQVKSNISEKQVKFNISELQELKTANDVVIEEFQNKISEKKQDFYKYIHESDSKSDKPVQDQVESGLSFKSQISNASFTTTTSNAISTESDEKLEILQEISLACGVAVEILNEFLMFDKLEQDTLGLNKQEVNVVDFVTSSIKMIFVQIREKNIRLALINYVVDESYNNSHNKVDDHSNESSVLTADVALTEMFHMNKNHGSNILRLDLPVSDNMMTIDDTISHNISSACTCAGGVCDTRCYISPTDTIYIDKHKLDQVMRNLLSNAIKFTPSNGKITIKIMFKPDVVDDNEKVFHGWLVVKVIDSGAGISSTDLKKLFKQVVQFRPHELQAGGGSGLGLMITKGIVDLHGGTIHASSPGEGLGSTFTLKIPMSRVKESVSADQSPSLSNEALDSFDVNENISSRNNCFSSNNSNDNALQISSSSLLSQGSSKLSSSPSSPKLSGRIRSNAQSKSKLFDVKILRSESTNILSDKLSQYEELLKEANNNNSDPSYDSLNSSQL